ncbi:MAG TPA: nicotinamidase [Gammaproteobacteria bacterium]|nr:nicotinamidase [Gammaproteobacteria bacterium]
MMLLGNPCIVASIDVDAQYGFTTTCQNELPIAGGLDIVEELNQQAKFARLRVGTKDAHPKNAVWIADKDHPPFAPLKGQHVDTYWPEHCVPGTKGFQSIQGLPHPSEYNFFVWKGIEPDMHPYGACYHDLEEKQSTGLIEFLRNNGIKTVIIGGLATEYCVKKTSIQLRQAGFRVFVNLGACRGINKSTTDEAIQEMTEAGVKFIKSAKELKANG